MLFFYISFFILGAAVGSFLNVVILRLKARKSILKERSHCPFCQKKLAWFELIPILSFFFQRGRCRYCGKRISLQYPLVEFFTGLTFLLTAIYFFDFTLSSLLFTIYYLLITCFLIIIFVYDLKYYLVSNKIIYPAIIVVGIWYLVSGIFFKNYTKYELLDTIYAAIIGGGFFFIIVLISKGRWMGTGDAKIGFLMGLLLGLPQIFTGLFLAFLSGAVISIILLILKKKTIKSEIPFGPFLSGATFITLLWGDVLIKWYLGLFI